jgi:hypothetical protein
MRGLIFPLVGLGLGVAFVGCTSILGDFSDGPDDGGADTGTTDSPTDGAADVVGTSDAHADGPATSDGEAGPGSCTAPKTSCTTGGVASCVDTKTDSNNCGTCGHACATGVTCSGGYCQPTTVLSGSPLGTVKSLACDATHVYWVNSVMGVADDLVYQADIAGGGAIDLSPTNSTGPAVNVGVSGSTVAYTLNWGGEQVQLFTATEGAAGSASELMVFEYATEPQAMTNAGSTFYSANFSNNGGYDIVQTTLSSTSGTTLASITTGQAGRTMATASNAAFWTDVTANTVNFYTAQNPNMMMGTVATSEAGAQNLTTDGNFLYWVSGPASGASLRKAAAHATSQSVTTVASVSGETWEGVATIASDGTNVYWGDTTSSGTTGIFTVPVAGGTPTLLAPMSVALPTNLAVCGTSLVWVEQGGSGGAAAVIRAAQL